MPEGHLKIIDRAKDVGKLNDGSLFAPKYIENKLKFFPNIKEAVAFGDGRDYCVAVFLNIDLTAVGNWAERNNILRVLPGTGRPSARLRDDEGTCRPGEPGPLAER
jgi:long-subunit acyl-CoA synthetase (AMP-forming)